jgi:GntP family gluconate:H+ symporter
MFLDLFLAQHAATAAPAAPGTWYAFVILAVSMLTVILGISWLRLHAFLALLGAALLAGVMGQIVKPDGQRNLLSAIEQTLAGFGKTAGEISIVIGMATIIGLCLLQSGAADKVVRRFLSVFGEKHAGIAILAATYFLSIPIFFDSMYMLMIPITTALAIRTGKDFPLYCMAVCSGGVITHSLTVPHPGPNAVVDKLGIDVGLSLWVGIAVGIVPAALSWFFIKYLNKRTPIPVRENPNVSLDAMKRSMDRPESQLPSLFMAVMPILLPILLISLDTVFKLNMEGRSWATDAGFMRVREWVGFIGNKSMALVCGAVAALWVLQRQNKTPWRSMGPLMFGPLETGAVIIMITAAGGAFGSMLRESGVAQAIQSVSESSQISVLLLSYLVAVVIRVAQGSATVAMQTTVAIVAGLASSLKCDPVYMMLTIGFGAMCCSWMNDSGFWVVSRLSGWTEKETLRTWTPLLTFVSIVGFLFVWLLATLWPYPLNK